VACGTRRVLAAEVGSCAISEQRLWGRLVTCLQPGHLEPRRSQLLLDGPLARRGPRRRHLAWRVKTAPAACRDRPGDVARRVRRRSGSGVARDAVPPPQDQRRQEGATVGGHHRRLVEFTVTVTDLAGRTTTSRFRIMTTLLDHEAYPAAAIAACYAERWQVELTYKIIKSTLRGGDRRLRGQAPDLAEQEIWGLLAVYNALVDQARGHRRRPRHRPRRDLFTVVLRAARDHLATHAPCQACGHHAGPSDLTAAIAAGPRNRTDRTRTAPRTKKEQRTQHTETLSTRSPSSNQIYPERPNRPDL